MSIHILKGRKRRQARLALGTVRRAVPTSVMDHPLIERVIYYVGKSVMLMAMLLLFICVLEVVAIMIGILFLK